MPATELSAADARGASARGRYGWLERVVLAALVGLIGWFNLWTVHSNGEPWHWGREQDDYFNLLIDGWLDGQLHMKVDVPEALLKLKDPYDPTLRPPGLGLHDASFHRGKYYLYFGAAPLVTLMLPFRLLTGMDLPLAAAVIVFVNGGFLVSLALWLAIRRRYFATSGLMMLVSGTLVLGLPSLGPLLLRRPHMWELPIAAAYCFTMLALLCLWRSLECGVEGSPRARTGRVRWYAGTGLALGLAIASRPSYLMAAPLLAVPLLWWWREERRLPWREMAAAAAPLAVVGALMALHNHLRFGSPWQFGQAYQFSLDYESKVTHFSAGYWAFNTWRYFFSPAEWSLYYPFIQPATLPPKPPGFSGHDDVYGVLVNMPVAWFALAAPLALWRRAAGERGRLAVGLASTGLLFAIMAALMLSFFGSLGRYLVDFTPAMMLLACVGGLALERYGAMKAAWMGRRAMAVGWGVLAVFSVLFAGLYTLQFAGFLRENNAAKDLELARLLNRIPAWGERWLGVRHGPLAMNVQLPRASAGQTELLLTTGSGAAMDRVFIRYLDDAHIQLGYAHGSSREQVSRPLRVNPERSHRVTIAAGSLFPPEVHPYFAGVAPEEVARLQRRLRIDFDGATVIEGRQHFFGASPGTRAVGRATKAIPGARPFSGRVLAVERPETTPQEARAEAAREHLRLRVRFAAGEAGGNEPLVSFPAGASGARILFVRRLGGGQVKFGLTSPAPGGETVVESDPVALGPALGHELLVTLGAHPIAHAAGDVAGDRPARRELRVTLDHCIVWTQTCDLPEDALRQARVGGGLSPAGAEAAFAGEIYETVRFRGRADPLLVNSGPLQLRVRLPLGRIGRREPLLVTGRTGGGNFLSLEYLDERTVRLAFDHWGLPTMFSEPHRLDFGQPHDVAISWGGFALQAAEAPRAADSRVAFEVRVNGAVVWQTAGAFYASEPEDVFVGREPLGATTCDPVFTGAIMSATRGNP